MPQPPRVPEPAECCGSGCEPCVFDRYGEACDRYERELAAWRARQASGAPAAIDVNQLKNNN